MNHRKTIKNLVLMSLLITLGQVLNRLIPMVGISIRPDFSLVFLFLCVAMEPTIKQATIASLFTVLIAIFFGLNPILQIPSFIDRFGSAVCMVLAITLITKVHKKYSAVVLSILFSIGTLISGLLYIGSCIVLSSVLGMPEIALVLEIGIIPLLLVVGITAVLNFFFGMLMLEIIKKAARQPILPMLQVSK